ncbi:MAG: DNA polymerase I [Bacillota bacterium]
MSSRWKGSSLEEKLVLIDGNSLANRAFYALPRLTTSGGVPTNAVYGFATMLLKLLEEERPAYVGVAFDKSAPTFRHLAAQTYKAQRSGSPEDFKAQLPLIKQLLSAIGIKIFEHEGYEADDIIGTIAAKAASEGLRVLLVSGDMDLLQLVGDRVTAVITRRGTSQVERYDREAVKQEMGVFPEQIPDLKGLAGDQSDNIKGVPGIGEKTATKLLERYGSLEAILDKLDELEDARARRAIHAGRQQAVLSKQLAVIRTDVPVEVSLDELRVRCVDPDLVVSVLECLEFRSLVQRALHAVGPYTAKESSVERRAEVVGEVEPFEVAFLESSEDWDRLRKALQEASWVGVGVCSEGADPRDRRFGGMGLWAAGKCWFVPPQNGALVLEMLRECGCHVAAFDSKNALNAWSNAGLGSVEVGFDPCIAAYLLDPTRTSYYLRDLVREYLGKEPQGLGEAGTSKHLSCFSPVEACGVARAAAELAVPMIRQLEGEGLYELFRDVEMPLVPVLSAMELEGVGVDLGIAEDMSKEFAARIAMCEQEIYRFAGMEFNVNSPKQLAEVLFERLRLPASKKTKTGYSTDAEVLEELAVNYEIAAKVLEYRQLSKLKGTYLDGIGQLVNKATGRIHTTFNQTVTATGRLSSANPNMQNIPTKGELGRQLRRIFVPRSIDWLFLSADYSQIELRVLAHVSGDPALIECFLRDEDIHTRTAAEIFGVKPEEVSPAMRAKAKAINFGIIYGQTDYGLSKVIGESRAVAKAYIENYFQRYPGVYRYVQEAVARARETGVARTLMGRKRKLPDINSPNKNLRSFAERTAINTPIQGTAADLMKVAMIRCFEALSQMGFKAKMLLQVHDELVMEVPREELADVAKLVRQQMEGAMALNVPLRVTTEAGPNWYDMAPLL